MQPKGMMEAVGGKLSRRKFEWEKWRSVERIEKEERVDLKGKDNNRRKMRFGRGDSVGLIVPEFDQRFPYIDCLGLASTDRETGTKVW